MSLEQFQALAKKVDTFLVGAKMAVVLDGDRHRAVMYLEGDEVAIPFAAIDSEGEVFPATSVVVDLFDMVS